MRWLLTPVAVLAGMLMVVQAACNSMLEKALDRPVTVAVLSLSVGISVLLIGGTRLGSSNSRQTSSRRFLGGPGSAAPAAPSRCYHSRLRLPVLAPPCMSACLSRRPL
jgi:hypothetical protein